MNYSVYVIDTETTGLDYSLCDICELSILRISDGEQKTWCLKPLNPAAIEDKALKVNGHKKEDLIWATASGRELYREPADVVPEIEAFIISDGHPIENRIFVGQNPKFDYDFMKKLWANVGSAESFPFKEILIDTLMMVRLIDLCTDKKRSRYNLGSLVRDFGITKAKAHRADGDVQMTAELFNLIINAIKDHVATTFMDKYSNE